MSFKFIATYKHSFKRHVYTSAISWCWTKWMVTSEHLINHSGPKELSQTGGPEPTYSRVDPIRSPASG